MGTFIQVRVWGMLYINSNEEPQKEALLIIGRV